MKYIKFLILAMLPFVAACSGGGGGSSEETPVSVTVGGKVYDQELSGAEVEVLVGDTVVATTTTDSNGAYSVDLSVTQAARAQRCVVRARRGSFSLRTLLGNVGSISDAAVANGGSLSGDTFPAANVTNVSTAVAAIVEAAPGGADLTSQADIDAAVAAVDVTVVTKIAAIIKAVVDYGADTNSSSSFTATDTDQLAKELATLAESTVGTAFVDNLAEILITSDDGTGTPVAENVLVAEVENDPVLAVQLPVVTADLATTMVSSGYTYFMLESDSSGGNIVKFTLGDNTMQLYGADANGPYSLDTPDTGTWVDGENGVITVTIAGTGGEPDETAVLTVKSGNKNSVLADLTVGGVAKGTVNFRRVIPIGGSAITADNIPATGAENITVVDFGDSKALSTGLCNGVQNARQMSNQGAIPATCTVHGSGMLKIESSNLALAPTTYVGLLADSWNFDSGTPTNSYVSQAMSVAYFGVNSVSSAEAGFGRVYRAKDINTTSGGPINNPIGLRIDSRGDLSVRFTTGTDVDGNALMDIYKNNLTATRRRVFIGQTVDVNHGFGATVNYSVKASDATVLRYSVNLGKHSGGKLNAIFATTSTTFAGTAKEGTVDNDTQITASLSPTTNPLFVVNTRLLNTLSALSATDMMGTGTTATFAVTNMLDSTSGGTATFNRADASATSGTGTFVEGDGSTNTFTWAVGAVRGAIGTNAADFSTRTGSADGYPDTIVITNADGTKNYLYADVSLGTTNSFVIALIGVDASNNLIDLSGNLVVRQ